MSSAYVYGEVRLGSGGVVAGSDNNKAWPVFQAGANPVQLIGGSYTGGDASEFYAIAIVPPNFVANGTVTIDTMTQGLIVLNNVLIGGTHTATLPGDVKDNEAMKFGASTAMWIVPPYHQVIAWPYSAASTAALAVNLLGMDLVIR